MVEQSHALRGTDGQPSAFAGTGADAGQSGFSQKARLHPHPPPAFVPLSFIHRQNTREAAGRNVRVKLSVDASLLCVLDRQRIKLIFIKKPFKFTAVESIINIRYFLNYNYKFHILEFLGFYILQLH